MLSSVFLLNKDAMILIEKQYREKVPRSEIDAACLAIRDRSHPPPSIISQGDYTLLLHQQNEIWMIGVCEGDDFATYGVSLLQHLGYLISTLLKEGATENSIKTDYTTVYQILDLAVDFGFPFLDEQNAIATVINRKPVDPRNRLANRIQFDLERPWRQVGVERTTEEILVDVIETIDLVVSQHGRTEFCHIRGEVRVNSRLAGKPTCRIILASSSHFEDVQFHRCVELLDTAESKFIPFVPPNGYFTLMKYRLTAIQQTVPLWITPNFQWNKGSVTFDIAMKPDAALPKPVEEIEIRFSFPPGVGTPSLGATDGRVAYESSTRDVVWTIPAYSKKEPAVLRGSASTEQNFDLGGRFPMIGAKFIYVGQTTSGFRIERLETENVDGTPFKGVKYVSQAGSYEFMSGLC